MTNLIGKLQTSFLKPILPAFFFFAGVTYDSLTLTRIDRLLDNLILLLYLAVLGVLVILTGRFQLGLIPVTPAITSWNALSLIHRAQPHLAKGLQFLLGGLFSAYAIFYSQSTSFSTTAIFLGIIVGFLIANEFLPSRYSSLKMLVSLFALVTLSFFTFFLPVLTGWMNSVVFVTGALDHGSHCLEDRSTDIAWLTTCILSNRIHHEFSRLWVSGSLYRAVFFELDSTHSSLLKVRWDLSSD